MQNQVISSFNEQTSAENDTFNNAAVAISATNSSFFTKTDTTFPMAPKVNLISPSSGKLNSGASEAAETAIAGKVESGLEQVDEGAKSDENNTYEATPTKTSTLSQISNPPKTKREYL